MSFNAERIHHFALSGPKSLLIFLRQIQPFLQRQQLTYSIFVIQQNHIILYLMHHIYFEFDVIKIDYRRHLKYIDDYKI